eukprot:CAMPEP_0202777396 /NCGR_PEP_ID=MMETSP1388-20130828/52593_1 /ASSEMBLY_ACC=CAM_ASM_000864 /TAXON_ID=37098 /ORGANISM="Isochrysis sp, Strain CCMP1244" /LENGTH=70 /DNA_ID=CAMNT_0049446625 /DNA_START=6 /DNA_END=215 /DNA_ORIENTATION=+
MGVLAKALYEADPRCRDEISRMGGASKGPARVPKGAFGSWLQSHSAVFHVTKKRGLSSDAWPVRLAGKAR